MAAARAAGGSWEQLVQTRAGRIRTIVAKTFHLKASRARLRSEKDFEIDGEQIRLG